MMNRMLRMTGPLVWWFLAAAVAFPTSAAAEDTGVVVGRVYYIEGDLLRYVPEEGDWVAVVNDAPFGTEDTLYSGSRAKGELFLPNGTWIRIGNATQIQFLLLDADLSEIDVAAGVARFYNKGSATVIKATSPFGHVLAEPGTVFDFYVGENSVEVVALSGQVSFVHAATDAMYDVSEGYPSILADQEQVSAGEGIADPDWDRWNGRRESLWAAQSRAGGPSAEYLPPGLQEEAYALEENGRWENVPYEGETHTFWRPTTVTVGWSPFTVGRWTDWYGDQCWIPAEPFGYVTHHYGNWIYVRNAWYWAPPASRARRGSPFLDIGLFWYPGRVAWIHRGAHVGWVPLAPREKYYSRRQWGGPHTVVVTDVDRARLDIDLRRHAHARHAVVVDRKNFYRVTNYRDVRVTNTNRASFVDGFRAAPVVDGTVIDKYASGKPRYNYSNVVVKRKPHRSVTDRIRHNETVIREAGDEKAAVAQERVTRRQERNVSREARIDTPKSANYIVPANEVDRPRSELKFQQREIKRSGRGETRGRSSQGGVQESVQPDQSGHSSGNDAARLVPEDAKPPEIQRGKVEQSGASRGGGKHGGGRYGGGKHGGGQP